MQHTSEKFNIKRVQWTIWIFLFLIMSLIMFHEGAGWRLSTGYAFLSCACFAIIIYTNTLVLIPKLYRRGKKWLYILVVIAMIGLMSWGVVQAEVWLKYVLAKEPMKYEPPSLRIYMSNVLLNTMIFLFTLPLRLAFDYFTVRRQQEELQKRTAEAELNLLKAQVQPHFLFNTLNNIYFVAQRESPATAELLEKLSNIMRYFVDEGPKSAIPLTRELDFIRDYIDLEMLRMRHPLQLNFTVQGETANTNLPPMLMIPLVENVFKHGINKRSDQNFLHINVQARDQQLELTVHNRFFQELEPVAAGGNGLANLNARLQLLYAGNYTLHTEQKEDTFMARLIIPL